MVAFCCCCGCSPVIRGKPPCSRNPPLNPPPTPPPFPNAPLGESKHGIQFSRTPLPPLRCPVLKCIHVISLSTPAVKCCHSERGPRKTECDPPRPPGWACCLTRLSWATIRHKVPQHGQAAEEVIAKLPQGGRRWQMYCCRFWASGISEPQLCAPTCWPHASFLLDVRAAHNRRGPQSCCPGAKTCPPR